MRASEWHDGFSGSAPALRQFNDAFKAPSTGGAAAAAAAARVDLSNASSAHAQYPTLLQEDGRSDGRDGWMDVALESERGAP